MCWRSDALNPGASYPAIAVTVSTATDAPSQVTNNVSVIGGGSANAYASDPTSIAVFNCDINGVPPGVADVQVVIDEALGLLPAVNDLNNDGVVNVLDVQKEINAALGLGCPYN
jgi:hypothetical protein